MLSQTTNKSKFNNNKNKYHFVSYSKYIKSVLLCIYFEYSSRYFFLLVLFFKLHFPIINNQILVLLMSWHTSYKLDIFQYNQQPLKIFCYVETTILFTFYVK